MFIIDSTNRNTKVCPLLGSTGLAPKKINHLYKKKNEQQFKGHLLYLQARMFRILKNMVF